MELNVAEELVYDTVCNLKQVTIHIILNALGDTSLSAVAVDKTLKSLVAKGLIKNTAMSWNRQNVYVPTTPVEIIAEKQLQNKRAAELEAKRHLTPLEKNALVIARRKGLA